MNKKLMLLGSLILVSGTMLQACRLRVANDTDKTVIFKSNKGPHELTLKPGEGFVTDENGKQMLDEKGRVVGAIPFGKQDGEKGEMADLTLTVVGSDQAPIRLVQQVCSTNFETGLTASEIINHKLSEKNSKLYTFDNVKAGECGCSAKKE